MLNVYQIERHFRGGNFDPLLRGVAPIGLELPLPLLVRLSGQRAAVIALALKRVVELTYGPTALSRELTAALLDRQNGDGSFGEGARDTLVGSGDPLATAAAIAALTALAQDHSSASNPEAALARERAIASIAHFQMEQGLFACAADRTDDDRALATAFILTLLAGDEDFRLAVRFADVMTWFDEHVHRLDGASDKLWQFARIEAPAMNVHHGAVAAIAA